jgi:hypothetical protein
MIQRVQTHPEIITSIVARQAEIRRLTGELHLIFGTLAKEKNIPDGATLIEASGDTLVVDVPNPDEEPT